MSYDPAIDPAFDRYLDALERDDARALALECETADALGHYTALLDVACPEALPDAIRATLDRLAHGYGIGQPFAPAFATPDECERRRFDADLDAAIVLGVADAIAGRVAALLP